MKWLKLILLLLFWEQTTVYAQNFSDAEYFMEKGDNYYDARDFENAKKMYLETLDILTKNNAVNSLLYYQALIELAGIADEENDYYAAVRYMEKAIAVNNDTVKNAVSKDDGVYPPSRKLSDYYAKAGMWEKAMSMKQQRLDKKLRKRHYGNFDITLVDYMHWGENANYYKYAFRLLKNLLREDGDNRTYNYWMGECYYQLRDYDNALSCFEKADSDFGCAKVFAAKGNIKKALDIQEKIVANEKEHRKHAIYISGHEPYWGYLSKLAEYYILDGDYDKAIECERQNEPSAVSILNLGRAYAGKKQWGKAIDYATKAYSTNMQESTAALVLSDLAYYSFMVHENNCLQQYVSELFECASAELLSGFQELTYDERSRYIDRYTEYLNEKIPMYAYYVTSDTLVSTAFNASMLMKGALLTSENSVRLVIDKSCDDTLKELWEEFKADKYILGKLLERKPIERKHNTDSLQNVISRLEDSLVVKCKDYDNITKSLKLKWQDIQKTLITQDIAIEFLRIPVNNDSIMYLALTLRKDSKTPKMIKLFEAKQLRQVPDTMYYQCKEMTDLVWKPLQEELQGVKNIYFSPAGVLYNIGIEYLPGMEGYNIHRLSSTRELVTKKETTTGNRAVLYGGLNYNANLDSLSKDKSTATIENVFVERATIRGADLRGSKAYLKHTKTEVEEIGKELGKANWTCLLDTASIGTEESFKALSGKKVSTLHVATHGFYYTPEEADNRRYRFMLLDNNDVPAEDKALTRSGLIMAGANHILEGDTIPDNVEDGILTAKEIADIDLRGLDLVVLSACQTGLGDISNKEGVFGLQRGFKKAGANSILMSLWKVDDEATQILMAQFYKNWLSGQSKRQALLSAQKFLRKTEDGKYDKPKYWAAFILLDEGQ